MLKYIYYYTKLFVETLLIYLWYSSLNPGLNYIPLVFWQYDSTWNQRGPKEHVAFVQECHQQGKSLLVGTIDC